MPAGSGSRTRKGRDMSDSNWPTGSALSRRGFLGRVGVTALSASSLSALAAACGGSDSDSSKSGGPVTLELAMTNEPNRAAIQKQLIATFEKQNPNIKLKITKADFNTYYTKLTTNIAAGKTPDVFMMSGAYFYTAVYRKALHELDGFIASAGLKMDDYFTETANHTYQGKTYGIPAEIDVMGMAYNKTLFDAAKVGYPTADWKWADMLAAAQELTRKNDKGQQTYGIYSVNNSQEMWGNLVNENGGSFLTDDLTKGALDTPQAIEAVQWAIDLIYKHKVSPTAQGVSSLPGYTEAGGSPFLTGLVAMRMQGNYEMDLLSAIKDFEWDIAPMPGQKQQGGLGWTQAWVMGSKTKHPEEAWKLLHFLSTEGQTIMAESPGRGQTPSLKSAAFSKPFVRDDKPNVKSWLDAWDTAFDFDFHPSWFEYQAAYSKALDPVFAGKAPVADTLRSATEQVNQILARSAWFHA
jgi:multiple sugar transport system substrate-binding protein